MRNATKAFVSTFSAVMTLAGIEHGIGEVLQGNKVPTGIMIQSWPDSAFFRSLAGEPAVTILPNLFATGILAILFSMVSLVWATRFVQRKNGGLILIILSIPMLLFGGGIFPPILLMMIGAVATRIGAPLSGWGKYLSAGSLSFIGKLWPWSFTACLIAWLAMFPGLSVLAYFFGVDDPALVLMILFSALGFLLVTIFIGFAVDIQGQVDCPAGKRLSAGLEI